ncbi:hypothetical protein [Streptomyces sp. SID8352]|uniref:hypothetical protein n=1 Tax=Streptomyces sp. SID8352 TaxID=2690338 RepID=UPI0019267FF8|nr:hypothetical protein [Streptomyces sp. SID8352]
MGAVEDKITEEIAQLRSDEIAPGLAQVALRLARSMDDPGGQTALANAATALRAVMVELRKLAPVGEEGDGVDDIARERAERRARLRAVPAAGE